MASLRWGVGSLARRVGSRAYSTAPSSKFGATRGSSSREAGFLKTPSTICLETAYHIILAPPPPPHEMAYLFPTLLLGKNEKSIESLWRPDLRKISKSPTEADKHINQQSPPNILRAVRNMARSDKEVASEQMDMLRMAAISSLTTQFRDDFTARMRAFMRASMAAMDAAEEAEYDGLPGDMLSLDPFGEDASDDLESLPSSPAMAEGRLPLEATDDGLLVGGADGAVQCSSVLKKRRKKMRKHKHRKRLRKLRFKADK